MTALFVLLSLVLAALLIAVWHRHSTLRREAYIREYTLPQGLFERLRKRRPQLTLKDCQLVSHGLRQFFLAHLKSGRGFVSMPSQVADELWHEFILYTKNYQAFCRKAFGRFLHHTPAVALSSAGAADAGLRRVWRYACLEEHINPRAPTRLPLLFALDSKLGIADGFRYALDCSALRREAVAAGAPAAAVHCAGDLARPAVVSENASARGSGCTATSCSGGDADGCSGGSCGGGGCGGSE